MSPCREMPVQLAALIARGARAATDAQERHRGAAGAGLGQMGARRRVHQGNHGQERRYQGAWLLGSLNCMHLCCSQLCSARAAQSAGCQAPLFVRRVTECGPSRAASCHLIGGCGMYACSWHAAGARAMRKCITCIQSMPPPPLPRPRQVVTVVHKPNQSKAFCLDFPCPAKLSPGMTVSLRVRRWAQPPW